MFFQNHPLSGFPGIGQGVSCTRQLGRRRKRQADPTNINMELPVSDELKEKVGECLLAVDRDINLHAFGIDIVVDGGIDGLSSMLGESYPCPCSLSQAQGDSGRFQQQVDLPRCFVSTLSTRIDLFLSSLSLTQQCCYSNG